MDNKLMLLHLYAAYRAGVENTCNGKVRYSEECKATLASDIMNQKPTTTHKVEPYPCPFCGGWHLGGIWPVERMQQLLDSYNG